MAVIQEQREFVVQAVQGLASYHFNFSIEKSEHIRVFIAGVEKIYGTDFIVDVPSTTVIFAHPESLISGQWIYICGATPTERITDFIGEYVLSDAANSQGDNIQRQIQEINTKIKKCIRAPQDNYWPNEPDTAGLNLPSSSQRKNKLVGFDSRGKDIEMVDIEGRLDDRYLRRAANLSDVNDVVVSRKSLGLGNAAVCDVGTDAGNVLPSDYKGLLSPQQKDILTGGDDSDTLHTHLSLISKSEKGVTIPTLDSKRKILQKYIPDLEYVKCFPRRSENGNVAIFKGAVGDIYDTGKKAPSSDFVGTSDAQTISNKTVDCLENNVTNVGRGELADDFLSEEISEDATHDTIPTTKAVRDYGETKIPSSEKGVPEGVASLGADGKVPEQQLPPSALDGVRLHGDASVDHVVVFDDADGNVKDSGKDISQIVDKTSAQEISNKSINAANNTISNIKTSNFADGEIVSEITAETANVSLPNTGAIKNRYDKKLEFNGEPSIGTLTKVYDAHGNLTNGPSIQTEIGEDSSDDNIPTSLATKNFFVPRSAIGESVCPLEEREGESGVKVPLKYLPGGVAGVIFDGDAGSDGTIILQSDSKGHIKKSSSSLPNSKIVGVSDNQTLSNKTFDCERNSLSNIKISHFKQGEIVDSMPQDVEHSVAVLNAKGVKTYADALPRVRNMTQGPTTPGAIVLFADDSGNIIGGLGKPLTSAMPWIPSDSTLATSQAIEDFVAMYVKYVGERDAVPGNIPEYVNAHDVQDSGIKTSDIVLLDVQQELTNKLIDCSDDGESSNKVINLSITSVAEKYLCRDVSQEEIPPDGQFFTREAFENLWGQASGVCDLDENGQVPIDRLDNVPSAKLENVGSGAKVYRDDLNDSAQLRTISSGDNEVVVTQAENEIKISHSRPVIADLTISLGTELVTSGGIKNHVAQKSADTLTSANGYTDSAISASEIKQKLEILAEAALDAAAKDTALGTALTTEFTGAISAAISTEGLVTDGKILAATLACNLHADSAAGGAESNSKSYTDDKCSDLKTYVDSGLSNAIATSNEYTNQKDTATNAKINNLITSRAALLTKELTGSGTMVYSQITVGNVGDVLSVVMTDNGPTPSWTQPTTTSKIFFDAYMANEMSIDRATETLLPFNAIKNASDNTVFDTDLHEFVAPISGTYEFDITVALRVYDLSQRIAVFFANNSANGFSYHAVGTFKPHDVFSQEYNEPSVHSFPLRLSVSAGDRISAWIATNKNSLVESLSGYSASFWQNSTCHFSGSFIG